MSGLKAAVWRNNVFFPGQGSAELLLLSVLLFREGHPDNPLHSVGGEDEVCG